ncbi:recombinase family protein [Streptomyces sp. NPDC020731]|uniref:recombinase family protein n=1 Tax=Streptomyces sp. NPDC020731 TaxID=3365085 RepID=UPI003791788B
MVSFKNEQPQERARPRRAEGDLRRRRALADAAVGDTPAGTVRIERFRCVIYLCGALHTDIESPRKECTEYANVFGWEITDVIEERAGLLPPQGRAGLRQAVERVRNGEAGAVLTAWRSMISPVPHEYDEVAREIERAGGFLHNKDAAGRTP